MKSKLKDATVAKQKGFDHVKKSLKNKLKENILEPVPFFYDTEFDYGGEMPEPLMYIGEIPTAWKKWIKANKCKISKTFVAGECISKDGVLNLEAKIGKGAKLPVLKSINKELLKPFAKAQLVESVTNPVAIEPVSADVEEGSSEGVGDDSETEEVGVKQLSYDFKDIMQEFKSVRDAEHDMDWVKQVYQDLKEWKVNYNKLPKEEQAKLAPMVKNFPKVQEGLVKVMKADQKIDQHVDHATGLVTEYLEMDDHESKESISKKFEEIKESKEPHVIIYSSCWSYYSQITQIMRSCGLLSAIALKKDRGEITTGQVFQLTDNQKETLDTVAKEKKKDVIITGKDFDNGVCNWVTVMS